MHGHLIGGLEVDAFENIDFAACGPVGPNEPEGGPCAASDGHVSYVGDEEAFVVCFCRGDAHAGATGRWLACIVDTHVVGACEI